MGKLIDADYLKSVVNHRVYHNHNGIIKIIDDQPTLDMQPVVHAHWNKDADGKRCSNCKCLYWDKSVPATAYPYAYYCPHCGAKMDEGEEK